MNRWKWFLWCLPLGAQAASLTVAWYPNPEANITGYKIYVGTASRTYATPWLISPNLDYGGTNVAYTITNLAASERYFVAVKAVNTLNVESPFSSELITQTPVNPPGGLRFITNSLQGAVSPTGTIKGWRNIATFVTEVPTTSDMAWYRARVDWGPLVPANDF